VGELTVDMADARLVRALLAGLPVDASILAQVHAALADKDASALAGLTRDFPVASREGLAALVTLYGDASVLDEAERRLPSTPLVREALANLRWLAGHLEGARVSFDLADLRGYAYYTGARFAIYAPGGSDALVRGGRYDEVGAVFGRNRPAVGFSLDLRELVAVAARPPLRAAVRAPWGEEPALRAAIASLRAQGETVVCVLPGHESEVDEFHCDRELTRQGAAWTVRTL
jgi:ATP phosphoribosyltransferase regulatory subunit